MITGYFLYKMLQMSETLRDFHFAQFRYEFIEGAIIKK